MKKPEEYEDWSPLEHTEEAEKLMHKLRSINSKVRSQIHQLSESVESMKGKIDKSKKESDKVENDVEFHLKQGAIKDGTEILEDLFESFSETFSKRRP